MSQRKKNFHTEQYSQIASITMKIAFDNIIWNEHFEFKGDLSPPIWYE